MRPLALVLLLVTLLAPAGAAADGWVMLTPGPGYRVDWSGPAGSSRRFLAYPRVARKGWSPIDRWFQVAPGGGAVALWSAPTGLAVFSASGAEVLRRKGDVLAFRFSPDGGRLAFATPKGVEVLVVERREARALAPVRGVDWLGWTAAGVVARTRSRLLLIAETGEQRALAKRRPGAVAATGGRVVYFGPGSMTSIDLASGAAPVVTKLADRAPVINAELSPDAKTVLFATARRVYLSDGTAPVRALADAAGVHSLLYSPDGAAFVWAAASGGAVVQVGGQVAGGKSTPLPPGTRSARFRQDGGGLVLTAEDGAAAWDPATGTRSLVAGMSPEEGVNLTGDVVGGTGVAFYLMRSASEKIHRAPTAPPR